MSSGPTTSVIRVVNSRMLITRSASNCPRVPYGQGQSNRHPDLWKERKPYVFTHDLRGAADQGTQGSPGDLPGHPGRGVGQTEDPYPGDEPYIQACARKNEEQR